MKVLVTGSRDWADAKAIIRELSKLPRGPETILVHGDCPTGADVIANKVGMKLGFTIRRYPADWEEAEKRGNRKSAGPIRNAKMIREEHPDKAGVPFDFGLAFTLDMSRSRGTKDCTERARKAGIKVEIFAL